MPRSEVEAKLRGYPLRGESVESTWPTPAEWSALHQAAYEPWTLQDTNQTGTDWTGPTVITATVRTPTNAPFSTATLVGGLLGGSAPSVPHPYSVWFVFDDDALTQWGHSARTTHYVYPQEQHN